MEDYLSANDLVHLRRAVELALEAEAEGNLPIGCVITFGGRNVAEGKNTIWVPKFNPARHAEMEALQGVRPDLWANSRQLSVYSTLEPCLMCTGAILLHNVGRVIFGAADAYGGGGSVFGQMSPYFEETLAAVQWLGPAWPEACDPLSHRALALDKKRRFSIE